LTGFDLIIHVPPTFGAPFRDPIQNNLNLALVGDQPHGVTSHPRESINCRRHISHPTQECRTPPVAVRRGKLSGRILISQVNQYGSTLGYHLAAWKNERGDLPEWIHFEYSRVGRNVPYDILADHVIGNPDQRQRGLNRHRARSWRAVDDIWFRHLVARGFTASHARTRRATCRYAAPSNRCSGRGPAAHPALCSLSPRG
jgi:hypothetical protein